MRTQKRKSVLNSWQGSVVCMCKDMKKPVRKLQNSKGPYSLSQLHRANVGAGFHMNIGLG